MCCFGRQHDDGRTPQERLCRATLTGAASQITWCADGRDPMQLDYGRRHSAFTATIQAVQPCCIYTAKPKPIGRVGDCKCGATSYRTSGCLQLSHSKPPQLPYLSQAAHTELVWGRQARRIYQPLFRYSKLSGVRPQILRLAERLIKVRRDSALWAIRHRSAEWTSLNFTGDYSQFCRLRRVLHECRCVVVSWDKAARVIRFCYKPTMKLGISISILLQH